MHAFGSLNVRTERGPEAGIFLCRYQGSKRHLDSVPKLERNRSDCFPIFVFASELNVAFHSGDAVCLDQEHSLWKVCLIYCSVFSHLTGLLAPHVSSSP